jgi:hypothetical protein
VEPGGAAVRASGRGGRVARGAWIQQLLLRLVQYAVCRFLHVAPPARLRSIADSEACCRLPSERSVLGSVVSIGENVTHRSHSTVAAHRVVAPASTPMAAQAPELPAGREPMSERWCYFCGRRGQPTRGSSRGRKRVAFVRCGHTQPGRGSRRMRRHEYVLVQGQGLANTKRPCRRPGERRYRPKWHGQDLLLKRLAGRPVHQYELIRRQTWL